MNPLIIVDGNFQIIVDNYSFDGFRHICDTRFSVLWQYTPSVWSRMLQKRLTKLCSRNGRVIMLVICTAMTAFRLSRIECFCKQVLRIDVNASVSETTTYFRNKNITKTSACGYLDPGQGCEHSSSIRRR